MRPWAERTAELEETDGAYADYSAWEEWMGKRCDCDCSYGGDDCTCSLCSLFQWWEDFDLTLRAQLYSMMYDLAEAEDNE